MSEQAASLAPGHGAFATAGAPKHGDLCLCQAFWSDDLWPLLISLTGWSAATRLCGAHRSLRHALHRLRAIHQYWVLLYDQLETIEDEWVQEHVGVAIQLEYEAWERFFQDREIYDCPEDSPWYNSDDC